MIDEMLIPTVGLENKLRITVYNTRPEKTVMANCAKVTFKDVFATNGVAHVVDKVILPATQTIGQIVSEDVQLRTLHKALTKSGLAEELAKNEGQFTLFAPTDDAFSKLEDVLQQKVKN